MKSAGSDYRRRRMPAGFAFLNSAQTGELQDKTRAAQELLRAAGYERVMPASLDYPETFAVAGATSAFVLRDGHGDDLALRNDVTVQLIKGFCNQLDIAGDARVHRFYYTLPVFRDHRGDSAMVREVYQIGAEAIGLPEAAIISELLPLAAGMLRDVFHREFRILVGDAVVAQMLMAAAGGDTATLREAIVFRNAPAVGEFLVPCSAKPDELARLLLFAPPSAQFWPRFQEIPFHDPDLKNRLGDRFRNLEKLTTSLNIPELSWDPLILRRAGYYTGLIFEGYVPELPEPPLRGGAYDQLVAAYSSESLPASGFSLDCSSLLFHPGGI